MPIGLNTAATIEAPSIDQGTVTPPERPGFGRFDALGGVESEHSLFDVTAGAFEYGAADTARALSSRLGRAFDSESFNNVASSLKQFQLDHPQYAPIQVKNAWDLITNPKAAISHFSAGAPFMLALGGLGEIPFAGVPLQMALAYGVESQNAYESAIADGQDEQTAGTIGNLTGVLNAGLMIAGVNRMFKIPHLTVGEAGAGIVKEALANTLTAGKVLGLAGPALKNLAIIALETSLQGAVREIVPSQIEGKAIPSGFLERRIAESLDGAIAGEVFGFARNSADIAFGKVSATTPKGDPAVGQMDMFSRKDFESILTNKFQLPENRVQDLLSTSDAFAKTWAAKNNKSIGEFYANAFAHDDGTDIGEILNQGDSKVRMASLDNVKGFHSQLREKIAEAFGNRKEVSLHELDRFTRNPKNGVKLEEVVWTGLGDMISSVDEARRPSVKVPMQEVLQHLDRNEVQLSTYTKSEAEQKVAQQKYDDLIQQKEEAQKQFVELMKKAKTSQEQSQLLAQFKEQQKQQDAAQDKALQERYVREPAYLESQTPGDATNFRNLLVRFPFTEGDKASRTPRKGFEDSHWPGIDNVILDMHLDERQTVDGQSTHAGDIQSGLHQQGRKAGYAEKGGEPQEAFHLATVEANGKTQIELRKKDGTVIQTFAQDDEQTANRALEGLNGRPSSKVQKEAPAAPFKRTQDWVRLAAKFHLNEAIENGSSRISWDTGDQRLAVWGSYSSDPEGMKEFYDKIVVKGYEKYAKTLDPEAKVEMVKVGEKSYIEAAGTPNFNQNWTNVEGPAVNRFQSDLETYMPVADRNRNVGEAYRLMVGEFGDGVATSVARKLGLQLNTVMTEIFAPSIKITEKMRGKIQDEGQTLFQSNKASVRFLNDGRAVIKALENPDASSALEELFHVAERKLITGDDRAKAEQAFGITDGVWEAKHREKLAQNFLQYMRIGRAPDSRLQGIFSAVKNWMKKIYPNLAKDARVGSGKFRVSDELRGIFDRMFVEDADPVKAKRLEISNLNFRLKELNETPEPEDAISPEPSNPTDLAERARAEILSGTSVGDVGRELEVGQPTDLNDESTSEAQRSGDQGESAPALDPSAAAEAGRIKAEIKLRRRELWNLQTSIYRPGEPSPAARRAEEINSLPSVLGTENIEESRWRKALHSIMRPLQRLAGMEAGIREFPAGREFIARAGNVDAYVMLKHGLFNERLKDAYQKLTSSDLKWAMDYTFDENGNAWPNIVKLLDPAGSPEAIEPPTKGLRDFRSLHSSVNDEGTKDQIKAGLLRKLKNDTITTAKRSRIERMPRQITERAWHAMLQGSGREYDALIDHFHSANLEDNPNLKRRQVAEDAKKYYGPNPTRRLGQLEYSRILKKVPAIIEFDGKPFTVFHHEPYNVISTSIQRQFTRIGFVKEFGQGVMRDVGKGPLRKILENFGIEVQKVTKNHVADRLDAAGVWSEELSSLSHQALKEIAKASNIALGDSRETMQAKVLELSPNSLYENLQQGVNAKKLARQQLKGLRRIAVELKGIDPTQEPSTLLDRVKQRVQETVQDHLYTKLRDAFGKQGGNLDYFDAGMQLLQGMPFKPLPKNFYTIGMQLVSNVVGALQTSTSAAPNLVQTASLVPAFAGVRNFFEATRTYLADPQKSISTIAGLGALKFDILSRTTEPGYSLQAWGKYIQQGLGKVTGLSQLDLQNNAIAGEAFRRLGESWRDNGVGKSDVGTTKFLRLTDVEVGKINNGGMTDELLAKIVQNGVSGTQFRTESNWRKGLLENSPLAKVLFSYSSYTNGMARTVGSLIREVKGLNVKDPHAVAGLVRKLSFAIAGTAGAGMASIVLRQALKGQLNRQVETIDDDMLTKAAAGLWEAGIFGATQRVLEPFSHDKGVFERGMMGIMPQVTAVGRLMAAIIGGYGKYGRFDAKTRIWEAVEDNTPLARGMSTWLEHRAWPELASYQAAMGTMRKFQNTQQKTQTPNEGQLNPDYYPTALALQRGDPQDAIEKAQEFYSKIPSLIQQDVLEGKNVASVMQGFRASLVQRSPMNLRDTNQLVYLSKLSPEKRAQVLQTQARYMALVDAVAPRQSQD